MKIYLFNNEVSVMHIMCLFRSGLFFHNGFPLFCYNSKYSKYFRNRRECKLRRGICMELNSNFRRSECHLRRGRHLWHCNMEYIWSSSVCR